MGSTDGWLQTHIPMSARSTIFREKNGKVKNEKTHSGDQGHASARTEESNRVSKKPDQERPTQIEERKRGQIQKQELIKCGRKPPAM